jgi:hypothetical protein
MMQLRRRDEGGVEFRVVMSHFLLSRTCRYWMHPHSNDEMMIDYILPVNTIYILSNIRHSYHPIDTLSW